MTDVKNLIDSSSSDYNTARATEVAAILRSLSHTDLSPPCTSSDVAELDSAKDAAKTNADAVVATQTNLISTKTEELNDLVAEINSLNEQIVAAGGTTIDPGTTAQTVPTVSTNGPVASTSAGPSGSTSGAPTGSTSGAPTGPTSGAPTGSSSAGPSGSTSASTAGPTTTQSVEDLSQAASAATATKEAAAAAITAATATKEAAASVSSDLASIDLSSFLGSRRKSKRQSETTTVYPKPAQCGKYLFRSLNISFVVQISVLQPKKDNFTKIYSPFFLISNFIANLISR